MTITPLFDALSMSTAQYTGNSAIWRVRGASSIIGQCNLVSIYLSTTCTGTLLGTAQVCALGAWECCGSGSVAANNQRLSVCSLGGGSAPHLAVRIR